MRYGVGVDLGGTAVKMGLFTSNGELIDDWSIPTDTSGCGENILTDIAKSVSVKLAVKGIDKKQVEGLGIGIPGAVSNGVVDKCINLGWGTVDVKKELGTLCGLEVFSANDANVAALGEYEAGSGRFYHSIVLVTLGTGVGGGIIIDGHIISGHSGYGGEIGHIIAVSGETEVCNCGKCGCLEQYASATGIRRLALKYLAESDEDSTLRALGDDVTTKDIFAEAVNNDKIALKAVDYSMDILGTTLSNICHVVNPEAVIIGGGVAKAGDFLIDKIKPSFDKGMVYIDGETKLCLATLGDKAGIYGAFYLIR